MGPQINAVQIDLEVDLHEPQPPFIPLPALIPNSSTGARKGHRMITGTRFGRRVPRVRHELRWADETRYVPISPRAPGLRRLAGVAGGGQERFRGHPMIRRKSYGERKDSVAWGPHRSGAPPH